MMHESQALNPPKTAQEARAHRREIMRDLRCPIAFRVLMKAATTLRSGHLRLILPDGQAVHLIGEEPGLAATMEIRHFSFAPRILVKGDIGFAEGFMAGQWDTPDLATLLTMLSANFDDLWEAARGRSLWRYFNMIRHALNQNSRAGSKRNIHAHYDLGNEFYRAWLDPSMTYSAGQFNSETASLELAQANKYHSIARSLQLRRDDHVLEIGSGWGGFAEVAAGQYGARVTGITISKAQYDFARQRIFEAGLAERVDIQLRDYRDIEGSYDKIASIEMFEAVGEKYWPSFFTKVNEVLKPEGRATLQVITIRDDLFAAYRVRSDFIQRFIFPGGMLPSIERLRSATAQVGLVWENPIMFGGSYADTLRAWTQRFQAKWHEISQLGFDERFRQVWRFYLAYCEAGFRTGRIDVGQFSLVKQD